MAILEKEVSIGLSPSNIGHYESLGYEIPKVKNKKGKMTSVKGTKILVKVEDMLPGTKVTKVCDDCGKHTQNQAYSQIITQREKGDGKDRCFSCGNLKMHHIKKQMHHTKDHWDISLS